MKVVLKVLGNVSVKYPETKQCIEDKTIELLAVFLSMLCFWYYSVMFARFFENFIMVYGLWRKLLVHF